MPTDTIKENIQAKLLELLKKKSIGDIKVTEICQELGISRGCFYLRYNSVYAVLQEIEDRFFKEYSSITGGFLNYDLSNQYCTTPHPALVKDVEYLKSNSDMLLTLFGPFGDIRFQSKCTQLAGEHMISRYRQNNPSDFKDNLVKTFLSRGLMHMTIEWLRNDSGVSVEEFAMLLYKMIFRTKEYIWN